MSPPTCEPDFMVVQVDQDQDRDVPLVCIEVKKEMVSIQAAGAQLGDYIDVLVTKKPHKAFVGILVLGGAFYCYNSAKRRAPTPGGQGWQTSEGLQDIFEKVLKRVREEESAQAKRKGKGVADAEEHNL